MSGSPDCYTYNHLIVECILDGKAAKSSWCYSPHLVFSCPVALNKLHVLHDRSSWQWLVEYLPYVISLLARGRAVR